MSIKSRGNWNIGGNLSQEQWESIFGRKERSSCLSEASVPKYKLDFMDNPNAKDILKIGKEINRFKQLDGLNNKEIERRFGKEANRLFERKIDKGLVKQIARDVSEQLKRG